MKFELLGSTTSTTNQTISADLKKYSAIMVISCGNDSTTNPNPASSAIYPMDLFKISVNVQARWTDGSAKAALATYVNDTSFYLRTLETTRRAWAYGVI